MLHRIIKLSKQNSFFLFGPRGVGKSTWLRNLFADERVHFVDLLNLEVQDRYARNPSWLFKELEALSPKPAWVVIDEIQKNPKLLDGVHESIESQKSWRFALTGSSARKLKRGASNLLAGRASVYSLFPFTHLELKENFSLPEALTWGTLPKLLDYSASEEKARFLRAYALTYLKEEIQEEQLVRNLDPFRSFLEIAAQTNGQIVNFSRVAFDVGVDTKTVQSYFQILEDTLIGFFLEPYHKSVRKRQRTSPKFFLFDPGIRRALEGTLTVDLIPGTYAYGAAFEHWVLLEAHRLNAYFEKDFRFFFLRTKDDAEVDLIMERPGAKSVLVEIKSTTRVSERDFETLRRFEKDFPQSEFHVWSLDERPRKEGSISVLPWHQGLREVGLA